jgi:predicted PurR-regulated permease PerM
MIQKENLSKLLVLFFFGIFIILAFFVIKGILISIIVGLIFAYLFHPLFLSLNKKVSNKTLSATIILIAILVTITLVFAFILPTLIEQALKLYKFLINLDVSNILAQLLPNFSEQTFNLIEAEITKLFGTLFSGILSQLQQAVFGAIDLTIQLIVTLFVFFFSLRDAEKLKKYISDLSPFSKSTEVRFQKEFRNITNTVLVGQVLIGLLQALLLAIAFIVLSVPYALTLTFVAVIFCIIPFLGSGFVWIPVSIFLLAGGETWKAVVLFIYGLILVSTIDNFLRSFFLSKHTKLNTPVAFVGTIGGLYTFGIIGLILGPLILSYCIIIFDLYKEGKFEEVFKK